MGTRTMAVALCAVVAVGAIPGYGAVGPEQQIALFPEPKPPYSELFQVPAPKTPQKPPQPFTFVVQPDALVGTEVLTPEPRSFTPRIVCGMKMIEGTADMDPGIVKPIPERHTAKIRVLGPPPCADAAPIVRDRR